MKDNKFKFANFFRKHKSIVCYDLSELPEDFTIGDIVELYNKTGVVLVDSFKNGKKEINTHIIKL